MLNPFKIPGLLWRNSYLIGQLTRREFSAKYKGSYLGVLWQFVAPLINLGCYTFVFSVVLKARWAQQTTDSNFEFALILLAGFTAYGLFSEVVTRSPTDVLNNSTYVKKVVFPLEVLSVVSTMGALINSVINILLLILGSVLLLGTISPTIYLLPVVYVPLLLWSLGLGWVLSATGVYFRDMKQGVAVASQVLFFGTPIIYPLSIVPADMRRFFDFNPMTHVVNDFRRVLLWGGEPNWQAWLISTVIGLLICYLGLAWFIKIKKGFADVL